jgi:hypothetical protein
VTTADDVLQVARAQLGITEDPPGSNRVFYNDWYWGEDAAEPWCAAEVSWVFWTAGLPLPASTDKGFASCRAGAAWFQRQDRWAGGGAIPQPGWLVFFDWGAGIHHIGIVEHAVGVRDLYSLEGNTDERGGRTGGKVMRHHRTTTLIAGYGIPDLAANEPVEQPKPDSARPVLRRGMRGPAVRWWQANLNNSAGGRLHANGEFGRQTHNATVRFQRYTHLAADGIVGPKTWAMMDIAAGHRV